MPGEDGSWTILVHFLSFVTFIFEILDLKYYVITIKWYNQKSIQTLTFEVDRWCKGIGFHVVKTRSACTLGAVDCYYIAENGNNSNEDKQELHLCCFSCLWALLAVDASEMFSIKRLT